MKNVDNSDNYKQNPFRNYVSLSKCSFSKAHFLPIKIQSCCIVLMQQQQSNKIFVNWFQFRCERHSSAKKVKQSPLAEIFVSGSSGCRGIIVSKLLINIILRKHLSLIYKKQI